MKGTATWIKNDVDFVKWEGNNLDEIKELLGDCSSYVPLFKEDYEKTKELYIKGLGTLRVGDYLTRSRRNLGWSDCIEIHSWKTFPRLINEDIGSGLL